MSEELYDEEIAPKLLEVAQLCKKAGIPMLATVWFEGENSGTTQIFPTEGNPNPSFTLAYQAHQCKGNIDQLCIALARRVKPENDGSIVLRMLRGKTPESATTKPSEHESA
jgi:hypothetical protein